MSNREQYARPAWVDVGYNVYYKEDEAFLASRRVMINRRMEGRSPSGDAEGLIWFLKRADDIVGLYTKIRAEVDKEMKESKENDDVVSDEH